MNSIESQMRALQSKFEPKRPRQQQIMMETQTRIDPFGSDQVTLSRQSFEQAPTTPNRREMEAFMRSAQR